MVRVLPEEVLYEGLLLVVGRVEFKVSLEEFVALPIERAVE